MLNNPTKAPQDSLPVWLSTSLDKQFVDEELDFAQVCMGHHLILLIHRYESSVRVGQKSRPTLLAFDLLDNSIQEVTLDRSLFPDLKAFTFTKYKNNQIIRFGGWSKTTQDFGPMVRITIESFKPFSVKCEEIHVNGEDQPQVLKHTAQIYQDFLIVYGGVDETDRVLTEKDLWSFDLNKNTWRECQSFGDKPKNQKKRRSFILQDDFYIYAGKPWDRNSTETKDFFVLNLKLMTWKKLQQETDLLRLAEAGLRKEIDSVLYKGELLLLGNGRDLRDPEPDILSYWNPDNDSWSSFEIEVNKLDPRTRNVIVADNLLVACGYIGNDRTFIISILNLDHVKGSSVPETAEQKRLKSLFMNEEESDIKLKVQDQIIPAHKQILIEKSKYFANVFNSGMAESKQDIIEIPDCEDSIHFQEFLRFLYGGEIQLDQILSSKLLAFADKCVQKDLSERCLHILKYDINQNNAYRILDFARQENIDHLRSWCLKFLKDKISPKNIAGLVEYLNSQSNPEFTQENIQLGDKAINVVTNDYIEICSKAQNGAFYEDFLIKNIAIDTTLPLAKFISGYNYKNRVVSYGLFGGPKISNNNEDEKIQEEQERLKTQTVNLRDALYRFAQKNLTSLTENKISKQLPNSFLVDLLRKMTETQEGLQRNLHGEQQTSQ